jgi:hypothetical protein
MAAHWAKSKGIKVMVPTRLHSEIGHGPYRNFLSSGPFAYNLTSQLSHSDLRINHHRQRPGARRRWLRVSVALPPA